MNDLCRSKTYNQTKDNYAYEEIHCGIDMCKYLSIKNIIQLFKKYLIIRAGDFYNEDILCYWMDIYINIMIFVS